MTSELVALSFAAADPPALAQFWAAALWWEVGEASSHAVVLVPTDGTRFTIRFRLVAAPKRDKNRIHLDLTTASLDDQRETVERLIALGADHLDVGQGPDDDHIVLADPEGNELCIVEPGNEFLATCGRFGSITCDGTPPVGYFWSAALGWPLVWDQDDETAIRAPDGAGPFITWGPPLAPKSGTNRLHLDIVASPGHERDAEIDRLVEIGATRIDADVTGDADGDRVVMADPDDNEFWALDQGATGVEPVPG